MVICINTIYGWLYETIDVSPDLNDISLIKHLGYDFQSLHLMNKRICVGKIILFYFNGEYTEDISNMICQLRRLNLDKSFIQKQHDQNF